MVKPALLGISQGGRPQGDGRYERDQAVGELIAAVQEAAPGIHVVAGVVDVQQPDIADSLASFAAGEPVVVVPLLLSAGYHVHGDLARELAEDRSRVAVLSHALGPDDALVQLLAERLDEVGLADGDIVVLAAAGSSDHRAVRDCLDVGRRLAAALERSVTVGFISAAVPRLSAAIETMRRLHPGSRVVVASYLLSPGPFAELAAEAGGDAVTRPLLDVGIAPPRQLVELVLARYAAAAAELTKPLQAGAR